MKTNYTRLFSILVAVGFVLALSACDSDNTTTPPPPPDDPFDAVYDTTGSTIFVTDTDESGVAPECETVTWESQYVYVLTNRVFVNDCQTLIIEAGTVIKGNPGLRESATALVVARGGMIMAEGTASNPIIFTSVADNLDDPDDEPGAGSWGGVIILGRASTNTTPSELQIEGIPTTEARARYGGSNNSDNSGVFRYVSIRYGGTEIGAGNEINGLTLGGVGSGTTIDHVEVFANLDDGVEFFGGTVNTKHMVVVFAGDDAFDTDQGYRGKNQFWLALHAADEGDNGAEMDGGDNDLGGEGSLPLSQPVIWNATYIGSGDAAANSGLGRGMNIRDNSAASYYRSYFYGFTEGLAVEDLDGGAADSRQRLESGDMTLRDLLWGMFTNDEDEDGTFNEDVDVVPQDFVRNYLNANGSRFVGTTMGIGSVSFEPDGGFNPVATGPALTNLGAAPTDSFFDNASCIGAVCPGDNWLEGWTALDQLGYLAN
ncbi:MAG: T9SS C-terminal target domain-containing protein [Rubricoccaceae bacterium]|nr:T9SS C-terminal target domain-containing protein [Rubricoccaceae bacterium]